MTTMDAVTCPRCGATNRAGAMNCAACGINLAFAEEHPEEIERIRREDTEESGRSACADGVSVSQHRPILLPVLLLLGSFAFAFCLGEGVHELGHFLAHLAYGTEVRIELDPFGGSRILHGSSAPQDTWGMTSAAGPLFNLLVGLTVSLSLWRYRRPALLPLILWGPIALVQEGVTFSLGMLTPGGDADLIVESGVPAPVILGLGVLFLLSGVIAVCCVLPLVGLSRSDSFGRRFGVVAGGMVSFMILRLVGSTVLSPHLAQEQTVPLVFALLLATAVAGLYGPLHSMLRRSLDAEPPFIRWPAVVVSAALAVTMIMLQMAWFN